jgi:FkbM family methyltransferase
MGMAIENPVIVMALYDIGRDNWESYSLSYNTYLSWMENTLSLDANIVVFTESKFVKRITEYRKKYDPDFLKTVIIEKPLEELECYKLYYNALNDLMKSKIFESKIQTIVPESIKPLYNIIMFNKLFFLKEVKDNQYFNNDLLIWADAGGLRESINNYKGQIWPCLNKINQLDNTKATFFSHNRNFQIENPGYHSLSQIRNIQGTCFFIPSSIIDSIVDQFFKVVDDSIDNKYIGSDEKILDIMYTHSIIKHNLIKCTWRTYFNLFKKDGSDLFASSNNADKIFIDIGSHSCSSLSHYMNLLKIDNSWEIHAFEPNSLVDTKYYSENLPIDVKVHKKAVWTRTGKTILNRYGSDGTGHGTLLEETEYGRDYGDYFSSEIVNCISIIDILRSIDSNKKVYLYVDAEYSEYYILPKLLKEYNINNIEHIWIKWHGSGHELDNIKNQITQQLTLKNIAYTIIG